MEKILFGRVKIFEKPAGFFFKSVEQNLRSNILERVCTGY